MNRTMDPVDRCDGDTERISAQDRIVEVEDENRLLREEVAELKARAAVQVVQAAPVDEMLDVPRFIQPSSASTQRSSDQTPSHMAQSISLPQPTTFTNGSVMSGSSLGMPQRTTSNSQSQYPASHGWGLVPGTAAVTGITALEEPPTRQCVYSSSCTENTSTLGPIMMQNIGTVDGVASVAKVLLQRNKSSVLAANRHTLPAVGMMSQVNSGAMPM